MEKKWVFKTSDEVIDSDRILKVKNALNRIAEEENDNTLKNYPEQFIKLLIHRGVENEFDLQNFFFPHYKKLHNPFLMKDMAEAVERISKAINSKEKIMILGDYDVDGTTSAALMYLFLSNLTEYATYYIPDRYKEGYGISFQAIDVAEKENIGLIISLDCGIKANDKIDYANEKGIDFIICDHHNPGNEIPKAIAVLDPKQTDCSYPFKELSGCGVGFKLAQAITKEFELDETLPFQYLDLVATSIAADIVPIIGENRMLMQIGLKKINRKPLPGILAFKTLSKANKPFEVQDIVFKIAPRINAAGRMSQGTEAVRILVSKNEHEALELAREVNVHNEDRRETDKSITIQARQMVKEDEKKGKRNSTVLFDPNWHKGVIGIVASRMIEKYYRPTIIFTGDGDIISGSARSVKGFSVYNAIEECSDLLIQFGGHKYAAGMTMKRENFEAFKEKFDRVVGELIQEDHLNPIVEIDARIDLSDIDMHFVKSMNKLAPFGPGNMHPIFYAENVLCDDCRELTDRNGNSHLKMSVFQPENMRKRIDLIGFGMGKLADEIVDGLPFEIVFALEENVWRNQSNVQMSAKDLKI